MYSGFNLIIGNEFDNYYELGEEIFDKNTKDIQDSLSKFILKDGSLDGSQIQEEWFPPIKADIFISHSHDDRRKAIALAGWLYNKFGIKSFIDSCIWGYSEKLLKLIDDKCCLNEEKTFYYYSKRNYSTSHVHVMLSIALSIMIDNTECIIFLNTPNSIKAKESVNKTKSPWIYSEITMTKLIRKKSLKSYRPIHAFDEEFFGKSLQIEYDLDMKHLNEINKNHLYEWNTNYNNYLDSKTKYPLDELYKIIQDENN